MAWWILATVLAFYIKGLCGFANTLIFQSVLSFSENNINISPVELVLGYPSNIILAIHERKYIKWRVCLPVAVLILIGIVPGILFLKKADTHLIKLIFGLLVILIGIEMLCRELLQKKAKPSKFLLAIVGILSGVLCGLYGIGVLVAAYMTRATENSHELKANISMAFAIENTARIMMYAAMEIVTLKTCMTSLKMMPFMLLGLWAGMISSRFLDGKKAKFLVIILLILSGILLIINTLA